MYTQRELICEKNPFTWMAQKQIKAPNNPILSQIGSGIKKGVGLAFNNPMTRAVGELQRAALPGAGKTRDQIGKMLGNIFRSSNSRYSRFNKSYNSRKQRNPKRYTTRPRQINKVSVNNVPKTQIQATAQQENRILVKTKVNGKISNTFGLVDDKGDIVATFHPFISQQPKNQQSIMFGRDTGFIVWDAKTKNQEIIDQPLRTTSFAKEPNFIAL